MSWKSVSSLVLELQDADSFGAMSFYAMGGENGKPVTIHFRELNIKSMKKEDAENLVVELNKAVSSVLCPMREDLLKRVANQLSRFMVFMVIIFSASRTLAGESIPDKSVVPLQIVTPQCDGQSCRSNLEAVSRGSAVAIDRADGHVLLLTARHCLPEKTGERMQVYIRGQWVEAEYLRHSKLGADLALIQAAVEDCEQLACISTKRTTIGQPVTIAGYLLGREFGARRGRITAIDGLAAAFEVPQVRSGGEVFGGSVIGGQSGGGVFDEAGDLVGITIEHFRDSPWQGRMVNQPELARFVAAAGVAGITGSGKSQAEPDSSPRVAPEVNPFRASPGQVKPPEDRPDPREPGPLVPEQPLTPEPSSPLPAVPRVEPLPTTPINPPNISRNLPVPELSKPVQLPQVTDTERHGSSEQTADHTGVSGQEYGKFWASLIPLGVSIAGAVATGGATWWGCVIPVTRTAKALREEIQQLRGNQQTVNPQGCFTMPVAPQVQPPVTKEASGPVPAAPFPRQLDEARQLLQLGKSEGRVPLLDALRGMFLDDELSKLSESDDPKVGELVTRLRNSIQRRVDSAAPISVKGL